MSCFIYLYDIYVSYIIKKYDTDIYEYHMYYELKIKIYNGIPSPYTSFIINCLLFLNNNY